jgi:hypothetical protein
MQSTCARACVRVCACGMYVCVCACVRTCEVSVSVGARVRACALCVCVCACVCARVCTRDPDAILRIEVCHAHHEKLQTSVDAILYIGSASLCDLCSPTERATQNPMRTDPTPDCDENQTIEARRARGRKCEIQPRARKYLQ